MTVQAIEADITYTFNDEGQYPFAFDILKPKDVTVQFIDNSGVRHVLAMGTDYLVVDNAGSRYIKIISTCGYIGQPGQLFIFRDMPVEQPTDWVNNEELDMELLEKSFDRVIMILQQFNTQMTSELAAITWRDGWKTGTVYKARDLVQAPSGNIYLATGSHTAGVFETDLLTGYWHLVMDIATIAGAALATKADKAETEAAIIALEDVPFAYQRGATLPSIKGYSVAADRAVLVWPRVRIVDHDTGIAHVIPTTELNINSPLVWDDGQYATAANRAGRNFCLYLLPGGTLLLSANSIAPIGHTTVNSLKIGGFHCLRVSVGTISGHRLIGFVAGNILPGSVWDLMHRPSCAPSGMVYSQEADIWVDIYLQSGTGANTASVYGGTITRTRTWMDFVDDLAAVSKRLLSDPEFQIIASGSNEKTNIAGTANPITTGGHIDTVGRRMISNIGCEDCCGVVWQWTSDQSYATDSATFAFSMFELPGGKGSIYKQGGNYGDAKLMAGGAWNDGANCGSRSRNVGGYRWGLGERTGARGCARSHT